MWFDWAIIEDDRACLKAPWGESKNCHQEELMEEGATFGWCEEAREMEEREGSWSVAPVLGPRILLAAVSSWDLHGEG